MAFDAFLSLPMPFVLDTEKLASGAMWVLEKSMAAQAEVSRGI